MTAWKLYCETCGDNESGCIPELPASTQMALAQAWFDDHEGAAHPDSSGKHVQVMVRLTEARQRV